MIPSRCVTFVLPFDDSDEEDGHDSDFENIYEPKEEMELDLDKEIILFEDDNPDPDSEPKEGTSFANIKEYNSMAISSLESDPDDNGNDCYANFSLRFPIRTSSRRRFLQSIQQF